MSDSTLTPFQTQGRSFLAVKLSQDNICQVAEELEADLLYADGLPYKLILGFNLEADLDEFLVVVEKDILITDHETFDFFFNPTN